MQLNQKVQYFRNYLLNESDEYRAEIKNEIYEYYFEIIGTEADLNNFYFLNHDNNIIDIEKRIDTLISKIIMHEHHDGIHNIIEEYNLV